MHQYATKQAFGGQRASVGRVVLLKLATGKGDADAAMRGEYKFAPNAVLQPFYCAGVIDRIDSETDMPVLRPTAGGVASALTFFDAKTEAGVDSAPIGSWMWPPRV